MAQYQTLQNSYGPEPAAVEFHHGGPEVALHSGLEPIPGHPPESGLQLVPGQHYYKPYEEQQQQLQPPSGPAPGGNGGKKKILGLSVALFWVLVGAAVLVVLGVALGVGLGVGLRSSQTSALSSSSSSSSTATAEPNTATITSAPASPSSASSSASSSTTSTSTTSAPVTSGTTGIAANSCTSTTVSTYYSSVDSSVTFTEYCFTDWPRGDTSAANSSETIADLEYTTKYTFEDCMDACVKYNKGLSDGETKCAAVTYNSNLTSIIAIGRQGGNCFLKDAKGVDRQGSAESASAAIVY